MATKTISIMDDAYERLARLKKEGESFSDVIRSLTQKKGSLAECAGLWSDWSKEDFKRLEKFRSEKRKENFRRQEKRLKWFKNTA